MKRIIIDTNFLLIPLKFRVDIFSEFNRICDFNYKIFIFDESINELKNVIEKQSNASELVNGERVTSRASHVDACENASHARVQLTRTRSQPSGIDKKAAQFALKLIKLKNIGIIKSHQKDVDELILNSVNNNTTIATQDINLKKKLLKKGASVIILRQKKYLQLIRKAL